MNELLKNLRSLDEAAKAIRERLKISAAGEEIFCYEVGDIDEDLIVIADGYGGASLQHVDGDGDNRLLLKNRDFKTERAACDVAERVMNDELELDAAFNESEVAA
jgi:hypothetical protein